MTAPVLIMAGGTGGHVFPALAVARELESRDTPVVWLGSCASRSLARCHWSGSFIFQRITTTSKAGTMPIKNPSRQVSSPHSRALMIK